MDELSIPPFLPLITDLCPRSDLYIILIVFQLREMSSCQVPDTLASLGPEIQVRARGLPLRSQLQVRVRWGGPIRSEGMIENVRASTFYRLQAGKVEFIHIEAA